MNGIPGVEPGLPAVGRGAGMRKWGPNRPPLFGTLAANLHRAKQGPQGNMLGLPAFSTCNALNQGAALGLA